MLYGKSGTGKTTILRLIAGLEAPDSGRILFGDPKDKKTAVLFQENRLFPYWNVMENILAVLKHTDAHTVSALLSDLMLSEADQKKMPPALSGGMARRVALARALLYAKEHDCSILLWDEPLKGLDVESAVHVCQVTKPYWENKTVFAVMHDRFPISLPAETARDFHNPGRIRTHPCKSVRTHANPYTPM